MMRSDTHKRRPSAGHTVWSFLLILSVLSSAFLIPPPTGAAGVTSPQATVQHSVDLSTVNRVTQVPGVDPLSEDNEPVAVVPEAPVGDDIVSKTAYTRTQRN